MHPNLIAALVEDRRRSCPCGAVTGQPHQLCRKCLARMIWRRHTSRRSRSVVRHQARPAHPRLGVDSRRGHIHAPHHRQGGQKLMLTILVLVVGAVMVLVLVLLAVVVVGIKQEPQQKS